jgi:putative flippase GtrA
MKQTVTVDNVEQVSGVLDQPKAQPSRPLPSYRLTPWPFANHILDRVDKLTGGRADWVQRFCTYLIIGGFAALVNLAVFSLVLYRIRLPFDGTMHGSMIHNMIASVLAAEISILANFIPNDYFTFRYLAGHERSWLARCTRYHMTSIVGSVLTFLIQFGFSYMGHVRSIFAQATALIIVLVYNFSFHHIFTYRRVKHATA